MTPVNDLECPNFLGGHHLSLLARAAARHRQSDEAGCSTEPGRTSRVGGHAVDDAYVTDCRRLVRREAMETDVGTYPQIAVAVLEEAAQFVAQQAGVHGRARDGHRAAGRVAPDLPQPLAERGDP
jgi:hypothetical protein